MLKCNWKQATRLLSSLLLVFLMGCAQDSALTEPKVVSENGDLGFRAEDPDPEVDCKCYMQVTRTENAGAFLGFLWGLTDVTSFPSTLYDIEGTNGFWASPSGSMNWVSFPSNWSELEPPSNGLHTFDMLIIPNTESPANDFTIYATVKCFIQNHDGSETLGSTTYHQFKWGDRIGTDPFYGSFRKKFSCIVSDDDGGPIVVPPF